MEFSQESSLFGHLGPSGNDGFGCDHQTGARPYEYCSRPRERFPITPLYWASLFHDPG